MGIRDARRPRRLAPSAAFLLGFVSYVAMVQPEAGAKLRAEVLRVLGRA
jgi:hypothetical protein